MNGFIKLSTAIYIFALLASAQLQADELQWQTYSAGMSDQEYRSICKHNQRRIFDLIKAYSKNTLLSMGVSKSGVKFVDIAAGVAANRETFILNKSRFLTFEFRDVIHDDRAMFLGIKMDW